MSSACSREREPCPPRAVQAEPSMGQHLDFKLVVKHTFLEVVENDEPIFLRARRMRALTDTALLSRRFYGSLHSSGPISPSATTLNVERAVVAYERFSPRNGPEAASASTGNAMGSDSSPGAAASSSSTSSPARPRVRALEEEASFPRIHQQPVQAAGDRLKPLQMQQEQHHPQLAPAGDAASSGSASSESRTTLMLRHLPGSCSRDSLQRLMDKNNFRGKYDFVYLPIDFRTGSGLGYAFVNMVSTADAEQVWRYFEGFNNWEEPSPKVCTVSWSSPHQGLADHVERYRNSPVMHPTVPEAWQPALFKPPSGQRLQFPPPTKKLKAPKLRPQAADCASRHRARGMRPDGE